MGSPAYMAPEQAGGGAMAAGPAADVYALGAVLYECLTGRPPFRGPTPLATLDLIRTAAPVPPPRLVPRVPRDLEAVCLACLEKEPGRRYATADAPADDLDRVPAGVPVGVRAAGRVERAARWARRKPTPGPGWRCSSSAATPAGSRPPGSARTASASRPATGPGWSASGTPARRGRHPRRAPAVGRGLTGPRQAGGGTRAGSMVNSDTAVAVAPAERMVTVATGRPAAA